MVDYYTFGDPDDPGRDADDATVTLSALPRDRWRPDVLPLIVFALLALLGGVGRCVVMRRRRGEANPTL